MKTDRAKALYRDYLIKYGRITGGPLSRRDVLDALEEFSDSIGLHRERLTEEVQFLVEDGRSKVDDLSSRISALQMQIAEMPRGSSRRGELDDELGPLREMLKDERSDATLEVAEAKAALAAFRKDKREFLIDAINTRFHGHDWRNR